METWAYILIFALIAVAIIGFVWILGNRKTAAPNELPDQPDLPIGPFYRTYWSLKNFVLRTETFDYDGEKEITDGFRVLYTPTYLSDLLMEHHFEFEPAEEWVLVSGWEPETNGVNGPAKPFKRLLGWDEEPNAFMGWAHDFPEAFATHIQQFQDLRKKDPEALSIWHKHLRGLDWHSGKADPLEVEW